MTNTKQDLVILDIPITFLDRSDLPYCQWIKLAEGEIGKVCDQVEWLEERLLNLPPFLVKREDQEALRKAKAWCVEAFKLRADWITAYNDLDLNGKSDLPIDQIVRLYGEKRIPFYHPNAEMQAVLHLAIRINGLSAEEAIEAVMLSYRLCDCWEAQRARTWKEVLS